MDERNYELPHLSFSFSVIVFNVQSCLIQGSNTSKTGYDRAPWSLVLLITFSSVFKASSGLKGRRPLRADGIQSQRY